MIGMRFKKIFFILVTIVTICTITYTIYAFGNRKNALSYVYDESVNIPEPEDAKDVPSYAKWEPKLGIYIREDMYYDKESRSFKERVKDSDDFAQSESYKSEKWLEENKNSDNKLYQAIINWEKNRTSTPSFSAIYDIKEDPEFKNNIVSLGVEYVPEMLDLAFKDDVWNWQMLAAVECITGIKKCLPDNVMLDGEPYKHNEWKKKFKEYMRNAKDIVESENEIENLGLFALPFISDEMGKGNDKYIRYLPSLVVNDTSVCQKSNQELEEWLKYKEKEISVLKSVLETYR